MGRFRIFGLVLIVGCGGRAADGSSDVGLDASSTMQQPFQNFAAMTRSMALADGDMQVSLTDAVGPIACGLSTNQRSGLGSAGHQILFNYGPAVGVPCPTGTFAVDSTCPASPSLDSAAVHRGCAYFRQWDASAQLVAVRAASAGGIQISGDEVACTLVVNMSFGGQLFSDTFTLSDGLTAQPWCSP